MPAKNLKIHPLTPDRWPDLEKLFGPRGACAGCWCMWWRLSQAAWRRGQGAANRRSFRALVTAGREPGLLAYRDGQPVGWCAVSPREACPRLAKSRTLKPVDDRPVWSVTCFFVAREARRTGVSVALLKGACDFVAARGGSIVEGYPVEPRKGGIMPAAFAWTGLPAAFLSAGFKEVARPSPVRPIMRRELAS